MWINIRSLRILFCRRQNHRLHKKPLCLGAFFVSLWFHFEVLPIVIIKWSKLFYYFTMVNADGLNIEQMSPDIYRDENWTIIFFQSVFSLYLCGFSGGGSANHLIWKPNTSSQYEFQRGGIALLRIDWW